MGARLNLTLTEKPDSIDVVKNTSVVEALLTITTDRGTYNLSGDTSGSIVVNGKTTSLNGAKVYLETTTRLYYEEIEVQHDADGRKTVTASASFDVNTAVRWVYASATLELTKIPRASALLFESITLGESCEISIERAVSGFKDTISYAFGTASGTIVELPTSAPEVSWTPPIELAAEIPNSPSGTGVFTVTTYDASGTEIGKKETPFSASVPTSLKPDVFPEISDERGYFDIYGSYVQTQSRLKVVARGAGIYGSTIDAWKINIDGVGYSNESVTVDLLSSNNALPVSVAVRDTRGQWSDDVKTTIKVLPYIAPTVTQLVAGRYDPEKNVMSEDGTQVAVKFSAVVTALEGQNSAAYHIKIREKGATSWRTAETLEGEGYTPGDVLVVMDSETTKAYELMVTAEDDFQSRDSVVKSVPIAFVFFHWSAVRRAFAFFQKAVEDATFRIAEGMAVRLPADTKVGEKSVKTIAVDAVYPVGSIYMNVSSTSPATLFGGTWVQIKDTFLLAAGNTYAAGSTGGEATHKLENAEMPRHGFHIVQNGEGIGTVGTGNAAGAYMDSYGIGSYGSLGRGWNTAGGEYYPAGHYEGGNEPHNNMPPYLAVYVWQRVA